MNRNVIWLCADGIRNYCSAIDNRNRLQIMDSVGKHSLYFKKVVCAAPSTLMSVSAMMTGVPAVCLARTYKAFDCQNSQFISLAKLLEKNGYMTFSILWYPYARTYLSPIFGYMHRKHPRQSSKDHERWDNDTINEILREHILEKLREPFFLFILYRSEYETNVSEKVSQGLQMLQTKGLLENTVLVLNSDHGFPDPMWGAKLKHESVLTEDNLLTPLVISYPGCPPHIVEERVSAMDIMPTILDLLNLGIEPFLPDLGVRSSLLSLVNHQPYEGAIRTDSRFICQEFRTVVLQAHNLKYINWIDTPKEELYDLAADPSETHNLADSRDHEEQIAAFRKDISLSEAAIVTIHAGVLKDRLERLLPTGCQTVAVLGCISKKFAKVLVLVFQRLGIKTLLMSQNQNPYLAELAAETYTKGLIRTLTEAACDDQKVDAALVIPDENPILSYRLRRMAFSLQAKRTHFVGYNLETKGIPQFWLIPLIGLVAQEGLKVLKTPKVAFRSILRFIRKSRIYQ
jgi:membrane-anchored protein YejM (alkaline phosphatase superfamily)